MDKIWKSRTISTETKKKMQEFFIFMTFLYGCETQVIAKEVERRILAFEKKSYGKTLRIGCAEKVSNEELCKNAATSKSSTKGKTKKLKKKSLWMYLVMGWW